MSQPGAAEPAPTIELLLEPQALPDREQRNPYLRYLLHYGMPIGASVAAHVVIAILLWVKTFGVAGPAEVEVGEWEGKVVEATDESGAFEWVSEVLATPDVAPLDESLDRLTAAPDMSFSLDDLAAVQPGGGIGSGSGLGLGDGSLSLLGTGSGAGEAGSGGFSSGLGDGSGRLGQAGVWRLSIQANKVAYVVDFSGSIIVAVDDLKRELKRSIGRLQPTQSFNVVLFYSGGGGADEKVRTESFKPKLEPADEATRREFFDWIDKKAPRGMTEPLEAIKRALALKPEAVFFFSDGDFDEALVAEIERANRLAKARIYCLVFNEHYLGDTSGVEPSANDGALRLRRIAEQNKGQCRIITGRDLASH